jgi:hypothetical protein
MHWASWPTALAVATRYVTVSDSIRDLAVHYTDLGVHGDDLAVHHTDLGVHDGPIWVSTMLRSGCPRWTDARTYACKHRHGTNGRADSDDSDTDAGVADDDGDGREHNGDSEEADGHHGGHSGQVSHAGKHEDKNAADIAAIDCSEVPSTDDSPAMSPIDAGP